MSGIIVYSDTLDLVGATDYTIGARIVQSWHAFLPGQVLCCNMACIPAPLHWSRPGLENADTCRSQGYRV